MTGFTNKNTMSKRYLLTEKQLDDLRSPYWEGDCTDFLLSLPERKDWKVVVPPDARVLTREELEHYAVLYELSGDVELFLLDVMSQQYPPESGRFLKLPKDKK